MKKLIVLLLLIVLCMSLALGASDSKNPEIQVTLVSQTPDPVEPGQTVKAKFKIENSGKQTIDDIFVTIKPKFPFSIYSDVVKKNIGKLRASSSGADAEIVDFILKVDEDAVEEEVGVDLELNYNTNSLLYIDDEFTIDIKTNDAILDITSIISEPKQIAPGETAKLTVVVKNLADSLLKDIKFKMDFGSSTLPLAPYQSSSERRIENLKTGFQDSLTFNLIADPSATPGLYKIPLNITYSDEKGSDYFISDTMAVTLGDVPKVRPFIKKTTVQKGKTPGKITVGIANAGTTDVKFVELFFLESEDYKLISPSDYYYIGDIDSDDTESEEIDVYINKKPDVLKIPVKLKYVDANNKPFQQQFDLSLNLYSTWNLKKFGVIESSNTNLFIILIIIVGGLYYYYYRNYKKKNRPLIIFGHTFGKKNK